MRKSHLRLARQTLKALHDQEIDRFARRASYMLERARFARLVSRTTESGATWFCLYGCNRDDVRMLVQVARDYADDPSAPIWLGLALAGYQLRKPVNKPKTG